MFTPYYGEFMIIPMATEFSFNRCSHGCLYCFSRLNNYKNRSSLKSVFNFLSDYETRITYLSYLFQQKYAICISNRTDPFSESNYKITQKVLEFLVKKEIPIALQTKGGLGIDDILEFLPPSLWYITICFDDESLREKIEPNAPSI